MKEDTRWKLFAGILLITLTLAMFTAHYLIFQDSHHLFIFFLGDLAFIPVEILIITLIIDQMLESREKQQRMEKLNMVIGVFFSRFGTPLLTLFTRADPTLDKVKSRLVVRDTWDNTMFLDVKSTFGNYTCSITIGLIDKRSLKDYLCQNEDFLLRLVENPVIFEHESFTDLILAINHLTEEMKMRGDFSSLPPPDLAHLSADACRAYSLLILEWLKYMEYLSIHYPYLFSLAMRTNPFDDTASVIIP